MTSFASLFIFILHHSFVCHVHLFDSPAAILRAMFYIFIADLRTMTNVYDLSCQLGKLEVSVFLSTSQTEVLSIVEKHSIS